VAHLVWNPRGAAGRLLAPKQDKLAIEQTSGRERINIHGANGWRGPVAASSCFPFRAYGA
jgi:hypothetical protein